MLKSAGDSRRRRSEPTARRREAPAEWCHGYCWRASTGGRKYGYAEEATTSNFIPPAYRLNLAPLDKSSRPS